MTIHRAANGAAIVGDIVVPAGEVKLLDMLFATKRPMGVPEIIGLMDNPITPASVYSQFKRLKERKLVIDTIMEYSAPGIVVKRRVWALTPETQQHFAEEKQHA